MTHAAEPWATTLIPLLVVAIAMAFRLRRMRREHRLRLERLWMLPAFYAVIVAAIFWSHPPHGLTWLSVAIAFIVGLPLGWYRGKLMRINVDPQTHALSQRASPAAILFVLGLVALRYAGRSLALATGGDSPEAIFAFTDMLLASALGFLTMQRLEMALRARAMLDEARGRRA